MAYLRGVDVGAEVVVCMKRTSPPLDWESHLTPDETARLASLWREADEIRIRLEAIEVIAQEIQRRATGRAKFVRKGMWQR